MQRFKTACAYKKNNLVRVTEGYIQAFKHFVYK